MHWILPSFSIFEKHLLQIMSFDLTPLSSRVVCMSFGNWLEHLLPLGAPQHCTCGPSLSRFVNFLAPRPRPPRPLPLPRPRLAPRLPPPSDPPRPYDADSDMIWKVLNARDESRDLVSDIWSSRTSSARQSISPRNWLITGRASLSLASSSHLSHFVIGPMNLLCRCNTALAIRDMVRFHLTWSPTSRARGSSSRTFCVAFAKDPVLNIVHI